MHIQDIQHAVINCRKQCEQALKFIMQCEEDLQDQNNLDDLHKRLQTSGQLADVLAERAAAGEDDDV